MSLENASKLYAINGITLQLPSDHPIDFIKSRFKKYDEFLPFIVKRLLAGNGVVDVGANCGDTLAKIVPHGPNLNYIAIEPSETYFNYLIRNSETISRLYPLINITISKSAIGSDDGYYDISEKNGTAKLTKAVEAVSGSFTKVRLKNIINSLNPNFRPRLIKVDTDGSDYDVLNSGLDLINEYKPILFFECSPSNEEQWLGYLDTLRSLKKINYKTFYVFDNFGDFILATSDIKIISNLIIYFASKPSQTPLYVDVLAVASADAGLADAAINEYNQTKF